MSIKNLIHGIVIILKRESLYQVEALTVFVVVNKYYLFFSKIYFFMDLELKQAYLHVQS